MDFGGTFHDIVLSMPHEKIIQDENQTGKYKNNHHNNGKDRTLIGNVHIAQYITGIHFHGKFAMLF